jgi:hypothetical protein
MLNLRWMLTTTLTAITLAVATADANAQKPPAATSAPVQKKANATPYSLGIVVGLDDDKPEPSPAIAQLAAESNQWMPCCDPPGPTKRLWSHCPPTQHARSWQECIMDHSDSLGWMFTRPTCCCGVLPPKDASLWDWVVQRLPGFSNSAPECHINTSQDAQTWLQRR